MINRDNPQLENGKVDIAIIGAGVVGCALARRLTLDGANVTVLEKATDVLDGASKANSAILHTGFDAPPGSLEQRCIADGYRQYLEEHEHLGLPLLQSGALVLAWNDEELEALDALMQKARSNDIHNVQSLSRGELASREPHLAGHLKGGFEVPGEYLVDPWATAHSYIMQALANGATLHRQAEVLSGDFDGDAWNLQTTRGQLQARHVITAAGLYGDEVDQRLTGGTRFSIKPRKGQFVVFEKAASRLIEAIILPVPSATTKGIVICRTIFGNVLVGPTAEEQTSREDASTDRQTLTSLREKGIELIPALASCEVTAIYAGLRPATEYSDYQIRNDAQVNYTSVGGIRSTGLSAALGIANHVAKLIREQHTCSLNPIAVPLVPRADRLSNYHPRDWQEPGNQGIICHCEQVTRREILAVLNGPMPPATLQGLKRRTRVCMGQCQGFHCSAELAAITEGRLNVPMTHEHEHEQRQRQRQRQGQGQA